MQAMLLVFSWEGGVRSGQVVHTLSNERCRVLALGDLVLGCDARPPAVYAWSWLRFCTSSSYRVLRIYRTALRRIASHRIASCRVVFG